MLLHKIWTIGRDGTLAAETKTLRLVVCKAGENVRYLVLRHPKQTGRYPQAILAAGSETDVRSAMETAEVMASKLT